MRGERRHGGRASGMGRTRLARTVRLAPAFFAVVAIAMLVPVGALRAQSGLTANGTINARIIHKAGIALIFNTNASGVALGGSGTAAATLGFGGISRFGPLDAGVTRTATALDFTVSTPFDVFVELGGGTSASYNLTASLSTVPGVFGFRFDAVPLSTTPVTVVANDPNYNANRTHTLYLTVPISAAPGGVSNTVNVTATAN